MHNRPNNPTGTASLPPIFRLQEWPEANFIGFFWEKLLSFFRDFHRTYLFENTNIVGDVPVLCKFAINHTIDINSLGGNLLASGG
jgi:hypothetical protein